MQMIPTRKNFTPQFVESHSVKPAVKASSPCFKELLTHKFMTLALLEDFSIYNGVNVVRFYKKFCS